MDKEKIEAPTFNELKSAAKEAQKNNLKNVYQHLRDRAKGGYTEANLSGLPIDMEGVSLLMSLGFSVSKHTDQFGMTGYVVKWE